MRNPAATRECLTFVTGMNLLLFATAIFAGDAEDEVLNAYRPGLIATFDYGDRGSVAKIAKHVRWFPTFDQSSPVPERVTWRGLLQIFAPGDYVFHVHAAGRIEMRLGGEVLIRGEAQSPAWFEAAPVELAYGYQPLEVTFEPANPAAVCGLYWQGPKFGLEPVLPRWLWHEPSVQDEPSVRDAEADSWLSVARCARCHAIPGVNESLPAPALGQIAETMSPSWLLRWLDEGQHGHSGEDADAESRELTRRSATLQYDFTSQEAQAIAAFLLRGTSSEESIAAARDKPDAQSKKQRGGNRKEGRQLFLTVGCLACHEYDGVGTDGLYSGPSLDEVGTKRTKDFFVHWLQEPEKLNVDHRMPSYASPVLSDKERSNLAAFLAAQTGREADGDRKAAGDGHQAAWVEIAAARKLRDASAEVVARGRELVNSYRCANCHRLPDADITAERFAWPTDADWDAGCTSDVAAKRRLPRYELSPSASERVRASIESLIAAAATGHRADTGRTAIALNNCTACHARNGSHGIVGMLPELTEQHGDLGAQIALLSPPPLTGVGDKLPDAELEATLRGKSPRLRPWLHVRMPKFSHLSDQQRGAIQSFLIHSDRIPQRPNTPEIIPTDDVAARVAGARLVTAAGFGCTSCHKIGEAEPGEIEPKERGTDLTMVGGRIRREWFDRWVRNPARIIPRMEMPAIQLPAPGVLNDDLDQQLAAVWHVLNTPDFTPPKPNPLRIVRASNQPGIPERPHVLTDVLKIGDRTFIKPLLIGLPNRHNVLFDLATSRLSGWWVGDTANQRTKGKSWYWEAAGAEVVPGAGDKPELHLFGPGGEVLEPQQIGQFVTEFDRFEHVDHGIRFTTRLHFAATDASSPISVRVTQSLLSLAATGSDGESNRSGSGFRREYRIDGVPNGWTARLRVLPVIHEAGRFNVTNRELTCETKLGRCHVRLLGDGDERFNILDEAISPTVDLSHADGVVLDYRADLPVDRFPLVALPQIEWQAKTLDVVPGFKSVRLPLPEEWMPTGLAWRHDGTLVVASLKGRVWLARDGNGDGLEDEAWPFSDELAAPYGVAPSGEAIDVINKYGLLRLEDLDGDDRADRTTTLVSGWGHTADYHDWAVGLPRDASGNYYVTLPCQQDDRSQAAANLRGAALRLRPRRPTKDDPHAYEIEPLVRGLRFPMGVVLRHDGAFFTSDNQGNYTPFNELNHLIPGEHYGFINKLDRRSDDQPTARPAAVRIPHPWVRSVNGLCFLDTPAGLDNKKHFGPFEGHMIGCEYTTRQLVRISLQPVGDTFQGAIYPFSQPAADEADGLLGPIVCAVSPRGELYVGNMHDSGWGGGANIGRVVRITPRGDWPLGIAEVRATRSGFEIEFTRSIDPARAQEPGQYTISSFRRIPTPDYGGPDRDRRSEEIADVEVDADARHVRLTMETLREGFVYEFRIGTIGADDAPLFPAAAYYTLNTIPDTE